MKPLVLLLLIGLSCSSTPTPHPREPTDTDQCAAACEHLLALGCEEGKPLEDGTTCTSFCEQTQQAGHALNPTCAKQVKTCAELDSCGR
jgi:hypothetical protein